MSESEPAADHAGESTTSADMVARKHETGHRTPDRRSSLSQCTSRSWRKRIVALLFPILVLIALEILFRMFGLYEEPGADKFHVKSELGTVLFPEWDRDISYPKPSDMSRLFVLGGSSARGFGVDRPFSDLLREKLDHQNLESRWEVINGAVGAYGSHRVLAILERACEFEPDWIVIYMGHNEFLEEVFYHPNGVAAYMTRLGHISRQFRVVNGLRFILPDFTWRPNLPPHFLGNTQFPLIRSAEQYTRRIKFLEANIVRMIAHCRARGVEILMVPAVANLLFSPGDSKHNAAYQERPAEWDELFEHAKTHADVGQWPQALVSFGALHAIDDEYALSRYALGMTLLAMGDQAKGQEELLVASQHDKRGIRANPDVVRIILDVCTRASVPTIDVSERFYSELREEFERIRARQPSKLFLDHCHPTQHGHQIIADAILERLSHVTKDQTG